MRRATGEVRLVRLWVHTESHDQFAEPAAAEPRSGGDVSETCEAGAAPLQQALGQAGAAGCLRVDQRRRQPESARVGHLVQRAQHPLGDWRGHVVGVDAGPVVPLAVELELTPLTGGARFVVHRSADVTPVHTALPSPVNHDRAASPSLSPVPPRNFSWIAHRRIGVRRRAGTPNVPRPADSCLKWTMQAVGRHDIG